MQTALTAVEETLLSGLYTYDFLTVRQAQRLYYAKSSINYVGERLGEIVKKGYAEQHFLPRRSKAGRAPAVFCLSAKGNKHFEALGYPPRKRYTPSEMDDLSYLFWSHTLAVNDIIIAAKQLEKLSPGYTLYQFLHDRDLKKEPVYVPANLPGKQTGVVPDAWLDFRMPPQQGTTEPLEITLVLELDRGSMPIEAMKQKITALLRYIDGPYQDHFHTESVTVCFATTAGEYRTKQLRTWCEQVLRETARKADSAFFYFTTLPKGNNDLDLDLDPIELFLRPVWYTPFDTQAKVLLEL